jgi:protein TonB
VIIFALVQARSHFVRKQETAMAVVNLSPPAPPPPAADTPPPPPPQVVAPKPIVQTPVPEPVIATTPVPMPVTPQPVAVTAPAPPVPVAVAPSVVRASDLGTRMVAGKPPRYPIESRRKHEEGTVVLALTLGVDGRVESINVSRSSGFARLDDAARDAVKGWRWEPTMVNGTPARVMGVVEIPFVLKG